MICIGIDNLPGEKWKPIPGYGGRYLISNKGRVYSVPRNDSLNRAQGGKLISPDGDRYARVRLYKDGEAKRYLVHRLVAISFIGMPEDRSKDEINHVDGNAFNNDVENLEWCTRKQNMRHAYDNGGVGPVGEINGMAKLTEKEVLEIREKHDRGRKQYKLAEEYGISQGYVSEIVNRKKWAWL